MKRQQAHGYNQPPISAAIVKQVILSFALIMADSISMIKCPSESGDNLKMHHRLGPSIIVILKGGTQCNSKNKSPAQTLRY